MADTQTNQPWADQSIIARHDQYMTGNYPRYPVVFVRGRGCELFDDQGKRYLDLFAGFGGPILGHAHPRLIEAVTEQARNLWHVGNLFHTGPQTLAAERISKHGFGGRSFFCHSGADANEAAIKLARLHGHHRPGPSGPRFKIITMLNSFHGRSLGTMVATGQAKVREGFEPLLRGFSHVPFNDLNAIKKELDDQTVAVMLEPIQGEGGVNLPDDSFLPELRKLCDEHDLLLICDEVWTGCGRTGKWFAYQHWPIEPDVMTLAKGAGGGLPVGVMCANERAAQWYDASKYGIKHATTLGGNCLSLAVCAKIFEIIEQDNLLQNATALGQHAVTRMRMLADQTGLIKAVRGKGLFVGIDLNVDAPNAWFDKAADVVNRCLEHGLVINGTQNTVLRLAPALNIDKAHLDEGLDMLTAVIKGGN